jgi:hypothetical protein
MYRNKVITTSLAVLAVATAISLVIASTSCGLVISAFAAKKGSDPSYTSSTYQMCYSIIRKSFKG